MRLNELHPEALAHIIEHLLPPEGLVQPGPERGYKDARRRRHALRSVHAARLAAPQLAAAAAAQLVTMMTLTPGNLQTPGPLPNWERFPKLGKLRLLNWSSTNKVLEEEEQQRQQHQQQQERQGRESGGSEGQQSNSRAGSSGDGSGEGEDGSGSGGEEGQEGQGESDEGQGTNVCGDGDGDADGAGEGGEGCQDMEHDGGSGGGGKAPRESREDAGERRRAVRLKEELSRRLRILAKCFGFEPSTGSRGPLGRAARGRPGGVTSLEMEMTRFGSVDFAALLRQLPRLKTLIVDHYMTREFEADPKLVSSAPNLEWLGIPEVKVSADLASELSKLRRLRALDVGGLPDMGALRLLPCERLTSLGAIDLPLTPAAGAGRFAALAELRGASLDAASAAALARAARGLRLLVFTPLGDWGGRQAFTFPAVSHVFMSACEDASPTRLDAAALMPRLQHAGLCPGWEFCNDGVPLPLKLLAGLTRLVTLAVSDYNIYELFQEDWDAVASMPQLRRLSCTLNPQDPKSIARLRRLGALEMFDVTLCYKDDADAAGGRPIAISGFLEAACRALPRLTTLLIGVPYYEASSDVHWDYGALLHFARRPSALRRLRLYPNVTVPATALGLLAAHPSLQRLEVGRWDSDRALFERLASEIFDNGGPTIDVVEFQGEEVCYWRYELPEGAGHQATDECI